MCAVVEPWKINELGGQALLILYEEGQALLILYEEGQCMNLNHFSRKFLMITFILSSNSDVRGARALTALVFAIVHASER